MNNYSPTENCFRMCFADQNRLDICARDRQAGEVVTLLARAARLKRVSGPPETGVTRLPVVSSGNQIPTGGYHKGEVPCILEPRNTPRWRPRDPRTPPREIINQEEWSWRQFMRLSSAISRTTHPDGGVLLHSALVRVPGGRAPENRVPGGILLAGCSDIGKTTACSRLPLPWRALADDLVLVVRNPAGDYHAHPWPTWSRLLFEKNNSEPPCWDVQTSVRLVGIFFLRQGKDRVSPMGSGEAAGCLNELSRQAAEWYTRDLDPENLAAFNRSCFDNLCRLVKVLPGFRLHTSLRGNFWENIDKALYHPR